MSLPDKLYRFTSLEFAQNFLMKGDVYFAHASRFNDDNLTPDQRDDEQSRQHFFDINRYQVTLEIANQNKDIPPIVIPHENVREVGFRFNLVNLDGPPLDYYICCLSKEYDLGMYSKFKAQACICIHNPREFFNRLAVAVNMNYGKSFAFLYGHVRYFEATELPIPLSTGVERAFMKNDKYSAQNEYRIALRGDVALSKDPGKLFQLGDLSDICSLLSPP